MLWCRRQRGPDCLGGTRGWLGPLDNKPVRIKLTDWRGLELGIVVVEVSVNLVDVAIFFDCIKSQLAEVGPSAVTVALPSRVASLMMVLYMSGATGGSVDHEFVVLTIAREVAKATVATGGAAAAGGAWLPVMALARLATTARKRVIFLVEGVDWLCRASLS
eukprot:CCRYP_006286-RB/>CCRYP_006286-RB protein AED:0.42 eAED:0.42 QI:0/0.33/0.25/1/0.33/0.25/4/123/161